MKNKIYLSLSDKWMIARCEGITENKYQYDPSTSEITGETLLCIISDLLFEYRRLEEKINDNVINIRIVK